LFAIGLAQSATGQGAVESKTKKPSAIPPLAPWRISFQRGEAIAGFKAAPALKLPFQCTSDGTVFVSMIDPALIVDIADYSHLPLTAISPSHAITTFQITRLDELYDVREIDHYASDSEIVFLVSAAKENKQTKQKYMGGDGSKSEDTFNIAPQHTFAVIFDRDAKLKSVVQLDDAFHVQQLGLFPSGLFLAYGYSEIERSPKMAMLDGDGVILKYLQLEEGVMSDRAFNKGPKTTNPEVFLNPVQFVPLGRSILMVQNKTKFPLLEVTEADALRVIRPKLPDGARINFLIPSDENLFALAGAADEGSLYELNPRNGSLLRVFTIENAASSAEVACVHEGNFLSFEHDAGALVPLVGTAERTSDSGSQKRLKPKGAPRPAGVQ
jgi:hypothetical protein